LIENIKTVTKNHQTNDSDSVTKIMQINNSTRVWVVPTLLMMKLPNTTIPLLLLHNTDPN